MYKVYGTNAIREALKNNRISKLFLLNGYSNKEILDIIKDFNIPYSFVNRQELDKMSNGAIHQGVIGIATPIKPITLNELINLNKDYQSGLVVMLDGLKDPHNLGAIIRSADIFNALGIIYKSKDSVSLNETVEKVSTGAINYVPICEVNNLNNAIKVLKDSGYWIVGLDGSAKETLSNLPYDRKLVIIVGSEGEGISHLVMKNCDYLAKIPMNGHGHINSLNASNACAIMLYEGFIHGIKTNKRS